MDNMYVKDQDEVEINMLEILRYLKKKIWIIAVTAIIFAGFAFLISAFILEPEYTASCRIYVLNQSNETGIVMSDFQVSSQMLNDYKVLITGRNVTEEVISRLGLNMSTSELAKKISVTAPENTRVLQIGVTDDSASLSADIANCVQEIASRQLTEIMGVDSVKLVYKADVPKEPSSPNVPKLTVLGGVLGIVVSVAFCVCLYLMDDTIRTEEDVTKYLGLSTLGVIPVSEKLNVDTNSSKMKKKAVSNDGKQQR